MAKLFSPFDCFARFANEDPDNPGTQVILNYTRRIQVTPNIGGIQNSDASSRFGRLSHPTGLPSNYNRRPDEKHTKLFR